MLPCKKKLNEEDTEDDRRRKLLAYGSDLIWRRGLAAADGEDYCSKKVSRNRID